MAISDAIDGHPPPANLGTWCDAAANYQTQTASGLGGYAGDTALLKTLSAAEQASIHGRIMLASGVVVPQRHALRAAAFPACLVGEAIRAAVTDADRQLLQHHAHPAPPNIDSESPAIPAVWQPTSDQRPRHAERTAMVGRCARPGSSPPSANPSIPVVPLSPRTTAIWPVTTSPGRVLERLTPQTWWPDSAMR